MPVFACKALMRLMHALVTTTSSSNETPLLALLLLLLLLSVLSLLAALLLLRRRRVCWWSHGEGGARAWRGYDGVCCVLSAAGLVQAPTAACMPRRLAHEAATAPRRLGSMLVV